jgi:hypothetical protein
VETTSAVDEVTPAVNDSSEEKATESEVKTVDEVMEVDESDATEKVEESEKDKNNAEASEKSTEKEESVQEQEVEKPVEEKVESANEVETTKSSEIQTETEVKVAESTSVPSGEEKPAEIPQETPACEGKPDKNGVADCPEQVTLTNGSEVKSDDAMEVTTVGLKDSDELPSVEDDVAKIVATAIDDEKAMFEDLFNELESKSAAMEVE